MLLTNDVSNSNNINLSDLNHFSFESAVSLGIICLVSSFPLAFTGERSRTMSFFLVGFYTSVMCTYSILANTEPIESMGYGSWGNHEFIYLASCIIGGAIGGMLASYIFYFGLFLIGAQFGFLLPIFIFTIFNYVSRSTTGPIYIVCVLLGIVFAFFFTDYAIIIGTSFMGGYLFAIGVDAFAYVGILKCLSLILHPQNSLENSSPRQEIIWVFISVVFIFGFGCYFQFRYYRKKKEALSIVL
jgi:hypothetical protein